MKMIVSRSACDYGPENTYRKPPVIREAPHLKGLVSIFRNMVGNKLQKKALRLHLQ